MHTHTHVFSMKLGALLAIGTCAVASVAFLQATPAALVSRPKTTVNARTVPTVGSVPSMSSIKRIPEKDRKTWASFCTSVLAPVDTKIPAAFRKAGKTPTGVSLPAVSRIRLLPHGTQRSWNVYCGAVLKSGSNAVSLKKKRTTPIQLSNPTHGAAMNGALPSGTSDNQTPSSSPIPSSVSSQSGFKGACVLRDAFTSLPQYDAADTGQGYAKLGKGNDFESFEALQGSCTRQDYDALGLAFCELHPGASYQMGAALYNQDNTYHTTGCSSLGCEWVQCPAVTGYKGACIIRDDYTSLPSYDAPDSGQGYAKLQKGNGFISHDAVKDACTHENYTALGQVFCLQHPTGSYQMGVATYNQDNSYETTGCGQFGCEPVHCGQ